MTFRDWLHDGWFLFFAFISVVMSVTFVAPAAFGLQNFTQWGGMYDDHWCIVNAYDANPHDNPNARSYQVSIGDGRRVFSSPAHNRKSCLSAVQIFCGLPSTEGWIMSWIEPTLKGEKFLGELNACDPNMTTIPHWFFNAQES